jgi:hypothetical protein
VHGYLIWAIMTAMIAVVVILALLTLVVATDTE